MAKVRTFIAVATSREAREKVGEFIGKYRQRLTGLRWVPPESLHLTIKFLGDLEEEQLPDFYAALKNSADKIRPFSYCLSGIGSFPNWKRPRVIWLGVEDIDGGLRKLHAEIENEFERLHFPRERRAFHPHLTLARVKDVSRMGENAHNLQMAHFDRVCIDVNEVLFMKSDLKPSGAVYTPLYRAELA